MFKKATSNKSVYFGLLWFLWLICDFGDKTFTVCIESWHESLSPRCKPRPLVWGGAVCRRMRSIQNENHFLPGMSHWEEAYISLLLWEYYRVSKEWARKWCWGEVCVDFPHEPITCRISEMIKLSWGMMSEKRYECWYKRQMSVKWGISLIN